MRVGGTTFVLISIFGGMNFLALQAPSDPARTYQYSFGGQRPPSDVTNLQSSESYGSDTRIFLAFKASPATISRIKSADWKWRDANDWAKYGGENNYGEPMPAWWTPKKTARTQVFEQRNRTGDFLTEDETLIYDVGTGQAYYSYHSVD